MYSNSSHNDPPTQRILNVTDFTTPVASLLLTATLTRLICLLLTPEARLLMQHTLCQVNSKQSLLGLKPVSNVSCMLTLSSHTGPYMAGSVYKGRYKCNYGYKCNTVLRS